MVRTCILCLVLSIFVTDPPFIGFFVLSQFAFAFALAFTFASAFAFPSLVFSIFLTPCQCTLPTEQKQTLYVSIQRGRQLLQPAGSHRSEKEGRMYTYVPEQPDLEKNKARTEQDRTEQGA